jgi:Co/Zn/Cd efflux system component
VAQEESTVTVLVATTVNAAIAVLKFVAGALTGSAAMFAEAAHSVADTATELLLLTALRRSARRPDLLVGRQAYRTTVLALRDALAARTGAGQIASWSHNAICRP